MKQYQIVKIQCGYAVTTKEALQDYFKGCGLLPYEYGMKYKKYLLKVISKIEKYKNNIDIKTVSIY